MMVYSILGFFRPAVYFFLLPLYLKEFSREDYGIYNLMIDFGQFMMVLVTLRINTAMMNFYYDYQGDKTKQRRYLRSLYSFSFLIGLGIIAVMFMAGESIFSYAYKSNDILFNRFGIIMVIYAVLSEINMVYFIYLKNEKNIIRYAFIVLVQVGLVMLFQFLFIIVWQKGVAGAVLGMLIANVITTLCVWLMEKDILTLKPDMSMVKSSLKFSIVLIPYLIIYWMMFKGGRLFLERMTDLSYVGLYTLVIVLTGVVILGVDSVINGVRPFLFDLFTEKNPNKKQMSLLTKLIINVPLLFIPLIVLIGCNMRYLTSNASFYAVDSYMVLACLVAYVLVYAKLFYLQLIYAKRSDWITALSFIAVLILIFGFKYFIPEYKIWGVFYATLIANISLAVLFYIAAQRIQPISFDLKSIFLNPLIVFIAIFGLQKLMISQGFSYSTFGLAQFLLILTLIVSLNLSSIKDYKGIFLNSKQNVQS